MREKNSAGNKGKPKNWGEKGHPRGFAGKSGWNKGLTKEDDSRLARPDLIGVRFGASKNGHTQETKDKLSKIAKDRQLGGYQQGSGRGKKGWYKGYWCDSTWELAWIIYNIDHGISFARNTQKFEYIFEDKKKNWIPDFIVDNEFVEIKGYDRPVDKAKRKNFPHPLTLISKDDIDVYINYVKETYTQDLISLYE